MISNSALYPRYCTYILAPLDKKKLRYIISDYIDHRHVLLQQVVISNTVHTVSGGRIIIHTGTIIIPIRTGVGYVELFYNLHNIIIHTYTYWLLRVHIPRIRFPRVTKFQIWQFFYVNI